MARHPTRAKPGDEIEIGNRVIDISNGVRRPDDEEYLKARMERIPGDGTEVDPVEIKADTEYPGKKILFAESDLYTNGKQLFVRDVNDGSYFHSEWLRQVVLFIRREGEAAVQNGTLEQDTFDSTIEFLMRLPGMEIDPLSPEEFYEYLIGEYVCKQCY